MICPLTVSVRHTPVKLLGKLQTIQANLEHKRQFRVLKNINNAVTVRDEGLRVRDGVAGKQDEGIWEE